jgi:hypothetical protein
MAAFCELALGLQPPNFYPFEAKAPKVSGRTPEYSHFRQTGTGDWVRSALRGRARSGNRELLRHDETRLVPSLPLGQWLQW